MLFGVLEDDLKASPTVLSTVASGYVLPLKSEPTMQASALQNKEFVQQYIQKLADTSCVKVVAEAPHICSPSQL